MLGHRNFGLLHDGGRVVQGRHNHEDDNQQNRPFGDTPGQDGGWPEPQHATDGLRERSRHDQGQDGHSRENDQDERDKKHRRAQFPHRPALTDLVDPVHRPPERADVP